MTIKEFVKKPVGNGNTSKYIYGGITLGGIVTAAVFLLRLYGTCDSAIKNAQTVPQLSLEWREFKIEYKNDIKQIKGDLKAIKKAIPQVDIRSMDNGG